MKSTDGMQMEGASRQQALVAFAQQMHKWDMAVPQVDPLVLDFGLGDYQHVGLIEYWLANEVDSGYCGKYLFLFDGQECPAHAHRVKHETFYPLHGRFSVTLHGVTTMLEPGQSKSIEAGQVHSLKAEGNALLLELSMPCDVADNQFEDQRIMEWLARSPG